MKKGAIGRLGDMRRAAVFRMFEKKFKAATRVTVGSATCENAAGAVAVRRRFEELMAEHGEEDIVLGSVGCSGRCDMEPVVAVISQDQIPVKYFQMTPDRVDRVFREHILGGVPVNAFMMHHESDTASIRRVISVCEGAGCLKSGAMDIAQAFVNEIQNTGLAEEVLVTRSACQGLCHEGPVAYVFPSGVLYPRLTVDRVKRIVREHIVGNQAVAEYAWDGEMIANRCFPIFGDICFFQKQLRLTLRNCGIIDPDSIDEYLGVRGYDALATVLDELSPAQVIEKVRISGLRGRGGGGFPTATKWGLAAKQNDEVKYIICNADEGDPGAFMDRSMIEGDPHSVLEGLIMGGYAIGATHGFIYIRAEYPLAIVRLERAIEQARAAGLLGRDILGSGWNFDIELRLGAGAFVCGEETALIQSIQGQRGMPRPRPPYPSESGLWGHPTVINNVETLVNIPVIILDGPEWFSSIGTERSKGTKVFALAGDVANTGLVEVPMGTSLRDVVYGVGGGMKDNMGFKAVQTGGPAGGCLPAAELDIPIDYDSLSRAGSIMGSGGMIVMNSHSCMVNVARFFVEFTQDESCGKCTPCREGSKRMLEILTRIVNGLGKEGDVEKLLRLAETMKLTSLCGLGQASPNPVISTIKHFRDEYDAHIREKRCPAGVCRNLLHYRIVPEKCVGCGACKKKCPVACIQGEPKSAHSIDPDVCVKCGQCFEVCKFGAVERR